MPFTVFLDLDSFRSEFTAKSNKHTWGLRLLLFDEVGRGDTVPCLSLRNLVHSGEQKKLQIQVATA
jgi:hypothetical protein